MYCPYCGSTRLSIHTSATIDHVNVGGGIGLAQANVDVSLWRNPNPKTHFSCESCEKSFIIIDTTADYILQNSGTHNEASGARIASLLLYYYSAGTTLTDLILNHCTGIVRPYRTKIPYISNALLSQKIHVCFSLDNQRTYLSLTKKRKKHSNTTIVYYKIDTMEPSI